MKALLFLVSTRFLKLVKLFSHKDRASEQKLFGLGQFVVLLTLAPFIFNLSLYSFGSEEQIPSHYEYDSDRFEVLPPIPSPKDLLSSPKRLRIKKLSPSELKALNTCLWNPFHQLSNAKNCNRLRNKSKKNGQINGKNYLIYLKELIAYSADRAKYQTEITSKYITFQPNQTKPEPLPPIMVKQYANSFYGAMMGNNKTVNAWQQVTFPMWLLGALLIIPTVLLCIRRQQWGLLAFGLSIPTLNYLLTISTIFFGWGALSSWLISSTLVPQIAFCWFALRGQLRSKSLFYFALLMVICTLLPFLTGSEEGFSVIKAQLPILVFIMVAAIARLIVKGAKENAYLLQNLGWSRSLRTGLRSLLLWLPMAALAIPFLYLTEVVIPQTWINHLHDEQILVFDHTHDILDNALQSTALKTDDVIYAWHMKIQGIKKGIYDEQANFNQTDLEKSVKDKFNEIVPKDLEFDEYESDAPIVGFIVDLSVDASQKSTNKAFVTFRNSMEDSLTKTASDNEARLKESVNNNVSKAFEYIDYKHEQGKNIILKANQDTQTSLWWTINFWHAAHQLALLFFAFICIKSFMYVFARVSFNRDTGTFVTLGNTKDALKENVSAQIKPTGKEYLINGNANETFYISRRFQCRGKAPKFTMPQPFYAPIARIFNGAYTMSKIEMQPGDDQVSCSATKGMEFFEWSLAEGETVILDFHYFVGMSESIKISTLISPRMSSLLLGKMIYSQATGPGKLILMTKGRAEIVESKAAAGSLPPERLIAMHKDVRLHIDSELDMVNIYLSTAYIRPAGGGKIIVDVDSQRGSQSGLSSFIKHFILPI